ncbi:MAG: hypothetical protein ACM3SU_13765 [Acidobacteriota bacterium]
MGAAAAFHPAVRPLGLAARLSAAFAAGAVGLTVEAVLFSLLRVRWTVAGLCLPLLVLSSLGAVLWSRRPPSRSLSGAFQPGVVIGSLSVLAVCLALAHLTASLVTARSTSVDYVFFWGVKAARFATVRGIDVRLLKWPFFVHAVPDYPPLVPVVGAWSALVSGRMHWQAGLLAAVLWLAAAAPIVLVLLRRRLPDGAAAAVTAFWTVALAVSLASSYCGGNAEAPLLFFETVAGAALLCEGKEDPPESRFLPALALAGAVLTKVEGTVGAALLVAGVLLRDHLENRRRVLSRGLPLVAATLGGLFLWFGFQLATGLEPGYRAHGAPLDLHFEHLGAILASAFVHLDAGTAGVSWLFPAVVLLVLGRDRRAGLPALVFAAGLAVFLLFDYLHDSGDPWLRIGWTLPRVSQPALSLLILAAGASSFSRMSRRDEARPQTGAAGVALEHPVLSRGGTT